jgi:uncharacterized protein
MQTHWLLEHGAGPSAGNDAPPQFDRFVEAIYWYPSRSSGAIEWQRRCQQWLKVRGINRPPMPESLRDMRKNFGYPHKEEDIPLL